MHNLFQTIGYSESESFRITDRSLWLAGGGFLLLTALLLSWKPILGVLVLAVPVVLLLVSHGPTAVACLVLATFTFFPLEGQIRLLPADILAFIVLGAYGLDLAQNGSSLKRNFVAGPFFIYLAVALLSIALQGFTLLSVRYFARLLVLVGTFMAVAHFGARSNPLLVLRIFVVGSVANTLLALAQFFAASGQIRAFGIAGPGFGDHLVIAILISAVMYLWSDDLRVRIIWGGTALLFIAGLAATQTRASVISAGWGCLLIIAGSLILGRRYHVGLPKKNFYAAGFLAAGVAPLLAIYTPLFSGVVQRFGQVGLQASETILLRVKLWTAATEAFFRHPVLGIGAGNFAQVADWVPDVKFDPVFYIVAGKGTHSVAMSALAETGLMGFFAMAFLFWRAIRVSYREMKHSASIDEVRIALALFVIAIVIMGSSIYAGAWFWGNNSYHMAIFFGLIASWRSGISAGRPGAGQL